MRGLKGLGWLPIGVRESEGLGAGLRRLEDLGWLSVKVGGSEGLGMAICRGERV